MVTTGGTGLKEDIMRILDNVHLVVATPGRILDLASKGVAKLDTCKLVVMDEVRTLFMDSFRFLFRIASQGTTELFFFACFHVFFFGLICTG